MRVRPPPPKAKAVAEAVGDHSVHVAAWGDPDGTNMYDTVTDI